jgi:aspartate racemase
MQSAMRTIGILGGMSAASTAIYYDRLNAAVRARLGGLHSAKCIIWSVDFAEIAALQDNGQWIEAGRILADAAKRLVGAGAQAILLATNTMHMVADAISQDLDVPLIHIADATAARLQAQGFRRPGLMATAFTMEMPFYRDRLRARFGLDVLVPDAAGRAETHRVIYEELCKGIATEASRSRFEEIAESLVAAGADSLILGCTEVCMLLNETNVRVPVFDTGSIHVEAAVAFVLDDLPAAGTLAATGTTG